MRHIIMLLVLLLAGCQSQSRILVKDPRAAGIADTNQPIEFVGKAAETFSEVLAGNAQTAQGRRSEMHKYDAAMYAGFIVIFVGGIIFAFLTKSRYGAVIPFAAVCGIAFIRFWSSDYAPWIELGVVVVALSLLVWKTWEYQKERNENAK